MAGFAPRWQIQLIKKSINRNTFFAHLTLEMPKVENVDVYKSYYNWQYVPSVSNMSELRSQEYHVCGMS
jgi:hypothetical protein